MKSVSIIGVGRVGGALALALPNDRYRLDQLVFHDRPPADLPNDTGEKRVGIKELTELSSDIVFITTRDSEISAAALDLRGKITGPAVVFHTSGSQPSSVLG